MRYITAVVVFLLIVTLLPVQGETGKQKIVILPVVASSPETGWVLGSLMIYFFPHSEEGRTGSTVDLVGYTTGNSQIFFAPHCS